MKAGLATLGLLAGVNTTSWMPRSAWRRKGIWPLDAPEHMFLARAVDSYGRILFGSEWRETDPIAEPIQPLRDTLCTNVPSEELTRAGHLLYENCEPYRERCKTLPVTALGGTRPIPTEAEWQLAVELSRAPAEEEKKGNDRFVTCKFALWEFFRRGHVLTAFRDRVGGAMSDIPAHYWNAEHILHRFDYCSFNPNNPFDLKSNSYIDPWIFVEKASFERAIQTDREAFDVSPNVSLPDNATYVSPYIRCMLATSKALGMSEAIQDKHAVLVKELPKHWGGPGTLTKTCPASALV